MSARKYTFKEGFSCHPFGAQCAEINNENLTDEIAEFLIESGRVAEDVFEIKPSKTKKAKEEPSSEEPSSEEPKAEVKLKKQK